jgi:hypothetical protein
MGRTKRLIIILGVIIILPIIFILYSLSNWLDRIILFILIFGVPLILGIIGVKLSRLSKIPFKESSECEYTNAVIYEFIGRDPISGKGTEHFLYNYIVDGREYNGWGLWEKYIDTLSVGDTIAIIYLKRDPYKSITKRDFELE